MIPLTKLKEQLSRVTSSGRYIPELDGLRFLAIASVFLQHVQQAVISKLHLAIGTHETAAMLVANMRIGVELFFVISGFILGLPFAAAFLAGAPRVSLGAYFLRRLTRLEPPYVISMLLCYGIASVAANAPNTHSVPHLLASLLYTHNFIYREFSTINSVAWSLEVEIQFYVAAPFLAAVLFKTRKPVQRRAILIAVCVVVFLLRHGIERTFGPLPMSLLFHLHYFLGGFLVADIYVTDWHGSPSKSYWADIGAMLGWTFLILLFVRTIAGTSMMAAVLLTVSVACSLRGTVLSRVLGFPPVAILGGMCYSIYLLHLPLIHYILPRVPDMQIGGIMATSVAYAGVMALFVIPISIFFFVGIERPCMDKAWPTALWRRIVQNGKRAPSEPAGNPNSN